MNKDKMTEKELKYEMKKREREREKQYREEIKEVVQTMSDFVNTFDTNRKNKVFCEEMLKQHRTLQQSFTGLCLEWIKTCSELQHYDLRNEASVKISQKIMDALKEDGTYLPMV